MENEFILELIGALEHKKTKKQINSDIKQLQSAINMLRITGTFARGDTKKELNSYIKSLQSKLNYVKLKGKFDGKNLKKEVEQALNNVSFKDIDLLSVDESKTKLKIRKVVADAKAFVDRNSIPINIDVKRMFIVK